MRVFSLIFATSVTASTSYLSWTADSFIQRGVQATRNYGEATLYEGYEAAYALTKNKTYADWYQSQIDSAVVLENGTIRGWRYDYYSLDDYRIGNNILWWYEHTGDIKYKTAADIIRKQLDRHPRTPTGGFWHRQPNYPNQMWLDGIFMADSFYAKWTSLFDAENKTAWDDIALQFDNIEAHTRNRTSGLLVHGYDESKTAVWADPVTGAAPLVWSRAVGWYFMSLLEVIPLFPESHPGRARLTEYFTTLAAALKKAQDEESGNWWLIMSEPYPGAPGNYIESSASAMFTFGWLKGIRLGLIAPEEYLGPALRAYHSLTERFTKANDDGTVNWEGTVEVGSLGSNGTYEYYISVPLEENDHRGAGSFMLASYEIERHHE
ncbi:glycoside hydrolase family 105 protein [Annulohypoxylon maeteangense]|uniref:glycoside hydrolase family 105 protein n=1 Tax=Annulohypoxylon maeteangense TaxID=1927788 RepID=UPI00200769DE|nr:glycoside hydrolase family 105 protein [Annulohypoxylon maeteangense]KAI0882084.1 glycoside hydrolase family 105 protein [Annulohypoxylon maeteangense]